MLTCGLDLTGIAEAETQQDFMDVLDKDVIEPLTALKVRQDRVFCTGIPNKGQSGRNQKLRQERGWRKTSKNPPQHVLIIQRTQSRSSSKHT
jgi:hypothetical protein